MKSMLSVRIFLITLYIFSINADVLGGIQSPFIKSVTALTDSSLVIEWRNNSTITQGFMIERSADFISFRVIATIDSSKTSYCDTSLTASTKYYYRLLAFSGNDTSAYSNVDSAMTKEYTYSIKTPTIGSITWDNFTKEITLFYNDECNFEAGFKVYESFDDGPYTLMDTYLSPNPKTFGLLSSKLINCNVNGWYTFKIVMFTATDTFVSPEKKVYALDPQTFLDAVPRIHLTEKVSDFPLSATPAYSFKYGDILAVHEKQSQSGFDTLAKIDFSNPMEPKFIKYIPLEKRFYVYPVTDNLAYCGAYNGNGTHYGNRYLAGNEFISFNGDSLISKSVAFELNNGRAWGHLTFLQINDSIYSVFETETGYNNSTSIKSRTFNICNYSFSDSIALLSGHYQTLKMMHFDNVLLLYGFAQTAYGSFKNYYIFQIDSSGSIPAFREFIPRYQKNIDDLDSVVFQAKKVGQYILDDTIAYNAHYLDTTKKLIYLICPDKIKLYKYEIGSITTIPTKVDHQFNSLPKNSVGRVVYSNGFLHIFNTSPSQLTIEIFTLVGRRIFQNGPVDVTGNSGLYLGKVAKGSYLAKITLPNNVNNYSLFNVY